MRRRILGVLLPCLAAGALAVPVAGSSGGHTHQVKLKDNFFTPKRLTVPAGAKIVFVWKGNAPHNLKAWGATSFSAATRKSGSVSKKLKKKGTVRVICLIHAGMKMRIKVE